MPDFLNGLFFSEILADNAGGGAVNVNGQGGANKQDEFIEIQSNANQTIDLNGYEIWSQVNGRLHAFGMGDTVAPGDTVTVIGAYNNPPPGSGFVAATDNPNPNGNANGGFLLDGEGGLRDTIYLVAPNGDYIRISYGEPAIVPTTLPTDPDFTFPPGGTQQGVGETIDSGAPNATSILRDADGNLVEGTPTPDVPGPVCFVSGTLITTDQGDIRGDDLAPGMRVLSKDHHYVPIRAIRMARIGRTVLKRYPDVRAIRIPAGVIGNKRCLRLSPAHRVLMTSAVAKMHFGQSEVLVSARQLVGHAGVTVETTEAPLSYFHLLCDQHEVILSEGCWSESLFLGDTTHAAIAAASGWNVETGLDIAGMSHSHIARRALKGYEATLLATHLLPAPELLSVA